jgi:hypothetical protein
MTFVYNNVAVLKSVITQPVKAGAWGLVNFQHIFSLLVSAG